MVEWGKKFTGEVVKKVPMEEAHEVELKPSLPDAKRVYLLSFKVQEPVIPWIPVDPDKIAENVRNDLKEACGLLGEDFVVHWYSYDEDNKRFQIQIERIPPEIVPPEGELAGVSILALSIVFGAIITSIAIASYFTVRLVGEYAEELKPLVEEAVKGLEALWKVLLAGTAVLGTGGVIYLLGKWMEKKGG